MLKFKFAPMLDIDDGLSIEGAEVVEVADPLESEEGAEELEVADPAEEEVIEGPTEQDSAWAEMRRRAEEAERRAQETEEQNRLMYEALGMYFPDADEDPVEMAIQARAAALGVEPEIERARFEAEREKEQLAAENQTLEEQLMQIKIEQMMEQGLAEVQAIDPKVKSLTDLGADFARYIAAGLDSTDAYFAVKAKEAKTKINPPKPIGKVESAPADSDYFSREEVEAMSDEEIDKNFAAIRKSMSKWK